LILQKKSLSGGFDKQKPSTYSIWLFGFGMGQVLTVFGFLVLVWRVVIY